MGLHAVPSPAHWRPAPLLEAFSKQVSTANYTMGNSQRVDEARVRLRRRVQRIGGLLQQGMGSENCFKVELTVWMTPRSARGAVCSSCAACACAIGFLFMQVSA